MQISIGHDTELNIKKINTIFKKHFSSDFRFNGEAHDFWECMYVVDGDVQVSADERVYALESGDIIFHKPMELHKFSVENKNGATIFVFSFPMEGRLCSFFENSVFSLNHEQKHIISDMINFLETKTAKYDENNEVDGFRRFYLPAKDSCIYFQKAISYIYLLFLSIADSGTSLAQSVNTPETKLFKSSVQFMQKNVCENLSVKDIARHLSISESGLKRIYTKFAGISVHKYFLNLKLNAATNLLRSGKTVSEVTELLNFSSQSYFSAAFKRETGFAPSKVKN